MTTPPATTTATTTAMLAGTFDPVTHGHLDLVRRACRLFPRVVVAVARGGKRTLFTPEERLALVRAALADLDDVGGAQAVLFDGLVVEAARAQGAGVLVRGMRGFQDWDRELQMAYANRGLAAEIDTLFLPPSAGLASVSSSLVREVAALGGDVSAWVPACVTRALQERGSA
ncbi:MAG: pantetheine-phosphate adenylyltransferase [Planctomycetota bacterium]|nr:pantetheine-phosphate adenylyltransferase [Planctomycetota bacterium]